MLALISGSAGRYFIGAVEPIDDYAALHKNQSALHHALQLAHVIRSGVSEADIDPSLFDAVHHSLLLLPKVSPSKQRQIEVAVSMYVLRVTGLSPDLTVCQTCRVGQPKDAAVFDGQAGGWRCLSCHGSFAGAETSLTLRGFKALKWLTHYPERAAQLSLTAEESSQLIAAVRAYLHTAINLMPPQHKQATGHNAASRTMHEPADVGGQLLGFRPGQYHAVIEGMQKTPL